MLKLFLYLVHVKFFKALDLLIFMIVAGNFFNSRRSARKKEWLTSNFISPYCYRHTFRILYKSLVSFKS